MYITGTMGKMWATVNKDFIMNRLVKNCPTEAFEFADAGKRYSSYIGVIFHCVVV